MVKKGLGKGLGAIFGEDVVKESKEEAARSRSKTAEAAEEMGQGEQMVKLSMIEPNREQPRKHFDEEQLQELAESIRNYGILQPLIVQKKGAFYEIVAGERRWRAAKLAGVKEVPVIFREYGKQEAMEIALIENIQREDLNAIEEARAYQQLAEEFHLTQEEIASRVSRNRATITNTLRLLKLDAQVQDMIAAGVISNGHGRALLGLEDKEGQRRAAKLVAEEGLSVRETEKLVKRMIREREEGQKKKEKKQEDALVLVYQSMEERMKRIMGTKVSIHNKDRNKGRIEIEYYSEAELERIVELIESIR